MKFIFKFDVSVSDNRKYCGGTDDFLFIGDERFPREFSKYCNNDKPTLDVWIPYTVDTNRFIFQFTLSTSLPVTTRAVGFHLQYSGE